MSPQRRASFNLADTLLAGEANLDIMIAGAVRAFGQPWPWIPGLCRALLKRAGGDLRAYSRQELADLIDANAAYVRAWEVPEKRPRIIRWAINPAVQLPRPEWIPQHLPHWRTPAQLAAWLGLSPYDMEFFARTWRQTSDDPPRCGHYAYRWQEKRQGGHRLIEIPKSHLRAIQRRLLHGFLEHIPAHQSAHGYVKKRSCLSHARLHQGQAVVIRFDLRDFFSSVAASRVHALFTTLGCPASVARLLTGLCTHRTPWLELNRADNRARIPFAQRQLLAAPHLPQGAPTSPALANLSAFRLDLRLRALADALGVVYSRYADDLVLSGGRELLPGAARLEAQIGAIALEEGFALNFRKTRCMRAGTQQKVTGFVVNRFANLPRSDYDALKAILHNCLVHGAQSQNRSGLQDFRAHLLGRIAHIATVHPLRGMRLKRHFELIDWASPLPPATPTCPSFS